jgi:hypothetical protein
MNPHNQQQYPPPGAPVYPPPGSNYGGAYGAPPPAGYPPAAPAGGYAYPPPPAGYPGAGAPPGYASYPPAMGIAGVPPGVGAQQQGYVPGAASASYAGKPPGGNAGAVDIEAQQAATYAAQFSEKKIRSAFVRKVFCLVGAMLAFTTGVAAIFLFVEPVNEYIAGPKICSTSRIDGTETCYRGAADGQWVFYTSWALTLVSFTMQLTTELQILILIKPPLTFFFKKLFCR